MIGVSTSIFADSNTKLEDALSILEDKTKYVELICDGRLNVMENIEVPLSFDLKYTLHCPLSDMNLSSFREKVRKTSIEVVEDILKVADKANASLIVLHPGYCIFKEDYTKALNALKKSIFELNRLQSEYSIKITIENMPSYSMFMFREPTEEIIEILGDVGITFDIGHSFLNNNINEFLNDKIIDKIFHIHIHDNNGEFDEHLCIGKGKIEFEKYKRKLKRINCIEMIEMQYKSIKDLDLCIERVKKLFR
ncbi:Xylose isomerase domain protein TIM barrel [Methanocaldococcus infernus ME]|uniref:Xylose isomerase domain protein TIM barrel n=1 Tax=Methanocaldococcus infernus (strain DSM 11812 / JCM 15783 / ME) TaxID=573063 RepID=D5VU08_METIM|nr:sugar phosphate isomerase/epimerase family protein [Methanocaldococcus infernus]ADG14061.1 Xylose isomerase domain protein TIM barrel [Methanocaldococcus infernus ME]